MKKREELKAKELYEPRPFMIRKYSDFKTIWDILISLLALVDALFLPLLLSFKYQLKWI